MVSACQPPGQAVAHRPFVLQTRGAALDPDQSADGGGQKVVTCDLTDAFQTFTPGVRVTKATFDLSNLPDGYISMDNIAPVPVPEAAAPALLLAGLALFPGLRPWARPAACRRGRSRPR
jgi:hypothetical protein